MRRGGGRHGARDGGLRFNVAGIVDPEGRAMNYLQHVSSSCLR